MSHPNQKEVDAWMMQELRRQGFLSRPGRPREMVGQYKVLRYWWHPDRIGDFSGNQSAD